MAYVSCHVCGETCNTGSKNTASEVIGWVAPRSGGGANHIRYPEPTGRHAHIACLAEQHEPAKANQQKMF